MKLSDLAYAVYLTGNIELIIWNWDGTLQKTLVFGSVNECSTEHFCQYDHLEVTQMYPKFTCGHPWMVIEAVDNREDD